MGIFSLFSSREKVDPDQNLKVKTAKFKKEQDEVNAQISRLIQADAEYKEDGDLDKRIAVYERILDFKKEQHWNSFNFCIKFVQMYVKADRDDDAWRLLNQMQIKFATFYPQTYYDSKIRYEQFKILKKEKKFVDALHMLALSYALTSFQDDDGHRIPFNEEKFLKEAKTTAQGAGISPEDLAQLANLLKKNVKHRNITEQKISEIYRAFMAKAQHH